MRLRAVLYIASTLALLLPASASAGGYATVGMLSLPEDVGPGATWTAEFEVLQHGITPYSDGTPSVILTRPDGDVLDSFVARPAGRPGVYRADVVFPESGKVRYLVDDDFGRRHAFEVVTVDEQAGTSSPGDGPAPALALTLAAGAGLACAALVALIRRRRSVAVQGT